MLKVGDVVKTDEGFIGEITRIGVTGVHAVKLDSGGTFGYDASSLTPYEDDEGGELAGTS